MGGHLFWQEACETLVGRDVHWDTSSIDPVLLRKIFCRRATERILFGSDYPPRSPQQDREILERIPWLTEKAKEQIRGSQWRATAGIDPLSVRPKACFLL